MAAILSATSTPFRKANHMVHLDPDEYNSIVGRSFVSMLLRLANTLVKERTGVLR